MRNCNAPLNVFAIAAALLAAHPAAAQRAGITMLPDTTVGRIDRAFAAVSGAESPGCAMGIARNGQVVVTRAYGLANLEDGAPNTPETIFESGSVAKQFTAAALILLAQDGKLTLEDDIQKYLPEVYDFGKIRPFFEGADLQPARHDAHRMAR